MNRARQQHRQSFRRDGGRCTAFIIHTVVTSIGATKAHTRDVDTHWRHIAIEVRHVFVDKVGSAVDGEHIAVHITIGRGQAGGHAGI